MTPIPKYTGINLKSLCAKANIRELTIEAMIKLTTRDPFIKLYNSPKITLRKTYSSKMGPTMDIKTINIGICLAIAINLSVFGLLCGLPLMANKIILIMIW